MTIEWLAGNRIRGTNAERTTTTGISPITTAVGGWKELTRFTLGSTSTSITTPTFDNKIYYKVLVHGIKSSGSVETGLRMNGVASGNKYAARLRVDDDTERTPTGQNQIADGWFSDPNEFFSQIYISNLAGSEKLVIGHTAGAGTAGVTTVPKRMEWVGKFVPSPDADVSSITIYGSGTFAVGSEVVVLGWDPADSHSTNFWEELASVDLTGGAASTLSSGTIAAKKYLWVQYYTDSIASSSRPDFLFNSDTGTNYSNRYNYNGTESVAASEDSHFAGISPATTPFFANFFIVNNSANEKISIGTGISRGGSGANTAIAQKFELAQKWTRTSGSGTGDASAQITKITLTNDASANFGTSTYLRVWGSN